MIYSLESILSIWLDSCYNFISVIHTYTEDGALLRIVLVKSSRDAANCWRSLLQGKYEADPLAFNNMEKKLTLERFQREVSG